MKNTNKKIFVLAGVLIIILSVALILIFTLHLGAPQTAGAKNFTIIVLPDTQFYSQDYPQVFKSQTQWIVEQAKNMNIAFVADEGDIVNIWNVDEQWQNANAAFLLLDNKVPYAVLPGNHDMSSSMETTYFDKYFPVSRYSSYTWRGGNYPEGKNDNSYQLFSAGGDDYIEISLEFCPTPDIINWANQVLKNYQDRRAIITTHGYLGADAERNIHGDGGGCTASSDNTQYIWDELVYPNQNVFLVLSGHVHAEAQRTDKNIAGKPVYQLLADYQGRENGGGGWLRIMEFIPSENKIHIKTYSPYLNKYETDSNSDFILDYSM